MSEKMPHPLHMASTSYYVYLCMLLITIGCGSLLERLGQCLERKGIRRISLASDQAFPFVTFLIHALNGHRNLINDPEEEKKELTEVEIECTNTEVCFKPCYVYVHI